MAGYATQKGGNFAEGSAGDDISSHQLSEQPKSNTKDTTSGVDAHPQDFYQQPAMRPTIWNRAAPGPGTGWFDPPTGKAVAPNYFGPLIQTTNMSQNAGQYPIPNSYQPNPYGNLQFSQNQQPWPNPSALMNNYQQYPPQPPPIHYQNPPYMAPTSSSPSSPQTLQAANNDADSESELEEGFLHPDTGRPVRKLLNHEKVLLKHFFSLKNPMKPVPSNRKVHLWQIQLPDQVQDEWIQFVLQAQTQAEALDREQALEEYRQMIIAMKNKVYDVRRSEIRGSRHGQVGRPAGSPNKPKNESHAKKSAGVTKKATPSKKVAPTKRATPKKGTKARRQIEENDDDEFNPNE